MSVASIAQLAGNDAPAPANRADLIARYIPSEAIAVYIGALGILVPGGEATPGQVSLVRLICFGLGIVVALIIASANLNTTGITEPGEARRRRIVVAALAALAFALYAAAMPGFFYTSTILTIAFTEWATCAAIAAAIILPYAAPALGVRLQTTTPPAPGT